MTARDLSGVWREGDGNIDLRKTSAGWEGFRITQVVEPHSGCPFPAGEVVLHIFGSHPNYTGEIRWVHGQNGHNCRYEWANATTVTVSADGNQAELESTSPYDKQTPERIVFTRVSQ
ncbi:hypothetical protein [Acrocarpospora catenulata]|uniref:hypothetical protein n=1 Tax=Acrocarpospora catenulata TaxID=2836182 RepID=UPI001BDA93E9|nr:hypothetical protein [Acrocarpospora catenulata]